MLFLYLSSSWQRDVRQLVGEPPLESRHITKMSIVAFLSGLLLIFVARFVRLIAASLSRFIDRWLPRRVSVLLAIILVGFMVTWLTNGVIYSRFVATANRIYSRHNKETAPGITQPLSPLRSGSPESLVPWETLGYQGRKFVTSGPDVEQLNDMNMSGTGIEPVRVYVGLQSAASLEQRVDLALKELDRTGAFRRRVLVVAIPTGTGWIEAQSTDPLEYMYDGNTAMVGVQYSFLPSWISFLVDKQNATETGQALYNAVYERWAKMPTEKRPKLLAYGLSLGSFGSQSAFSGTADLRNRADGALFIGTPNDTVLWRTFTRNRDAGSPERLPSYEKGRTVRFAANSKDLAINANWPSPHVVYLQHSSDPIVWWSPDLIVKKPAWLNEPRGPDVVSSMQWIPFITFVQVSVDQFFGTKVPEGYGHNYGDSIVAAWAAVAAPEGWNTQKTDRLQALINTYTR